MDQNEYFAWVKLALTPYIGAETFLNLLARYGSAQAVWMAPADEIGAMVRYKQARAVFAGQDSRAQQAAEAAINWSQQDGCRLMLLGDEDYPVRLGEGMTPPPLLFLRGNSRLLARPSVAIVGSRHATPQAMRIAHDFGRALSEQGITVVSGMASGIDTAAHQGALKGSGSTVAFWGTGIDRVYPAHNRALAHELADKGLIVSEFPLDTRPLSSNFPRRNRLIAALSQATLVVEAAVESGSLITARLAAEMGREVMAVPGSIDNPQAKGCHQLIKDGAKLAENLDDILQECPQLLQSSALSSYSIYKVDAGNAIEPGDNRVEQECLSEKETGLPGGLEHQKLLESMGYDPIHPDVLTEMSGIAAAEVYAQLLMLELSGHVAAVSGGRYQRVKP